MFESTERSAFSTTLEMSGDASARADGQTLGATSGLGSVKVGFFDASNFDLDDSPRREGGGEGGGDQSLQERFEKAVAACEAQKAECDRLRAELEKARQAELAQRTAHQANVRKMLDANEALQAQLKELNGVVERVVQKEIERGKPPPAFLQRRTLVRGVRPRARASPSNERALSMAAF